MALSSVWSRPMSLVEVLISPMSVSIVNPSLLRVHQLIMSAALVINFQLPNEIERVVHRVGRTGRAGKNGVAISFLSESDEGIMYDLKEMISKSALSTMNPELARHDAAKQRITKEMKRKRDEQE